MDASDERGAFTRAGWVNVLGNVLKIVVEGGVGLAFGSIALVADAAHSVADLLSSLVVLVWGQRAFEAADADHPHGHERIEPLTALFVAATLVGLAALLLYRSLLGLLEGPEVRFSIVLVGGLAFAIADMLVVYWYTVRVNERLDSPGLRALAADARNDILTSMAAVVGVFGVAVDAPVFDPLAGALVSLLVAREGLAVGRENLQYLVGRAPDPDKHDEVVETIRSHPAVEGVHDLRVYYDGPVLEVEFHAEVSGDATLREAHAIESELVQRVRAVSGVGDVHVHLDPSGLGEWRDAEDPEGVAR